MNFERNIIHQYNILKELHGKNHTEDFYIQSICETSGERFSDIKQIIEKIKPGKIEHLDEYGVVIMRAQPFHKAHMKIINQIILDGKIPFVLLGSDYGKDKIKNPLSVIQRKELIEIIYPTECIIDWVGDNEDWDFWFNSIGMILIGSSGRERGQFTLYTHRKEQDKRDFTYGGKEYFNESYPILFESIGIEVKDLDMVCCDLNQEIHGTNIRNSEDMAKIHLDARVYWKLKELNFWDKE